MMKIAEYKQIDTQLTEKEIVIPATYDENGIILIEERTEIITIETPIMGMVYRDATPEEELQQAQEEEMERMAFFSLPYGERVEKLIRERYSISDELAILRQRDIKPAEFEEYNTFAEMCKLRAKGSD